MLMLCSCCAVIPKLRELYNRYLDAYDVHMIVTPTAHLSAGPINQVQPWVEYNGKLVDTFEAYGQTVFLGPPLGLPAITLPVGLDDDGLPLGIQFQARPGERNYDSCMQAYVRYTGRKCAI